MNEEIRELKIITAFWKTVVFVMSVIFIISIPTMIFLMNKYSSFATLSDGVAVVADFVEDVDTINQFMEKYEF